MAAIEELLSALDAAAARRLVADARALLAERIAETLSQAEIARRLGVSRQSVNELVIRAPAVRADERRLAAAGTVAAALTVGTPPAGLAHRLP